jgi:hypothetical protein
MSYPENFDTSNLDHNQQLILNDFYKRRNLFNKYLNENNIEINTCPGCGFPALNGRGAYEICCVCNWEDDNQDDEEADEVWGGPNSKLSLTENRLNIGKQFAEIIEETGGQINTAPLMVLHILSSHKNNISALLKALPEDAGLNHPILIAYKQKGQELLKQLVTI